MFDSLNKFNARYEKDIAFLKMSPANSVRHDVTSSVPFTEERVCQT